MPELGGGGTAPPARPAPRAARPPPRVWVPPRRLSLVASGLGIAGCNRVARVATRLTHGGYSSVITPDTTHLVVADLGPGPGGRLTYRTYKYLMAVLLGVPIVTEGWVLACEAAGALLPPDTWAVVGDKETVGAPAAGAAASRAGGRLFAGLRVHLLGEGGRTARADVAALVLAGEGELVGGRAATTPDVVTVDLGGGGEWEGRGARVRLEWLMDSVAAYRRLPVAGYRV